MKILLLALALSLPGVEPPERPCQILPECSPEGACVLLDLTTLLARLETLPELEAAKTLASAAATQAHLSGRLPNPQLEAEFEDLGLSQPAWARSQVTLGLSQQLPLGKRREAERHALGLEAELAGAQAASLRRELMLEASRLFLEALAGEARLGLLARTLATGQEELARLGQRQHLGGSPDHELLTWALEVSALGARLDRECLDQRQRLGRLALLAGLEDWRSLRLTAPAPATAASGPSNLPELPPTEALQAARLLRLRAEAEEALQGSLARPDLTLGAGLRGLDGFEGQTLVFTLGLPLPLFDRNEAQRQQASGQVRAARLLERRAANALALTLQDLEAQQQLAQARRANLEQTDLPNLERLVAALTLRQQSQGGELPALMDARARLLEGHLEHLELSTRLRLLDLELASLKAGAEEVRR